MAMKVCNGKEDFHIPKKNQATPRAILQKDSQGYIWNSMKFIIKDKSLSFPNNVKSHSP